MKRNTVTRRFFGAALAASLLCAHAQQAATPSPENSANSAEEMHLYLVAHDKRGVPVVNVKASDLAVTDDGIPLKLDGFRLVQGYQTTPDLVTFVFDRSIAEEKRDSHKKKHRKRSSKVVSARDAAMKILDMLPERGFELSVLRVDSRLRLVQEFTPDRYVLDQAVEAATAKAPSRPSGKPSAPEKELVSVALSGKDSKGKRVTSRKRLLAQSMYSALKDSGRIAQDRHIAPSLSGLLALVQSQQDIPGRRTLVYLSWIDQSRINANDRKAIESIIGSANQAGVTIDVVDCTALGNHGSRIKPLSPGAQGALAAMNTKSLPGGSFNIPADQGTLQVWVDAPVNADLKHLAESTGGIYFNGDSQRKVFKRLIGDMITYYEASFVPHIQKYDGRFHPVVVRPLRKGLRVRTQTGYLALPPRAADGSRPQPFEMPLIKLLKHPSLPTELPFRAAVLNLGDHPDGKMSVLAIEIPEKGLNMQRIANSPTTVAHLTMVAYVKDETGSVVSHFSAKIAQRLSVKRSGASSTPLISLQRHFVLPPGKYKLEVLVRDDKSGKAGAQRIPFEISATSGAPSLSNLLLVRRTDPVRADSDLTDPLRQGKRRVTPSLDSTLTPGATRISVFFAAHADPHAARDAKLEIKVLQDGAVLGGKPLVARQVKGQEFFTYLSSFSINSAQDGTYQVEALLTQGGKTAESQTSFTLSGVDSDTAENAVSLEDTSRPSGPLTITTPTNPIRRPGKNELKTLLEDATRYAAAYWDSLPNIICDNLTDRFVSTHGNGNWKHRDTLKGTLTYFDHQEEWEFLELEKNSQKTHDKTTNTQRGITSAGIFGGVIRGLFRPASKAKIEWVKTGALGDGTVQIFKYRVARKNSSLNLRTSSKDVIRVGYHGMVYIDSATHAVRRITEIADDVPRKFAVHAALVSADYDYVSIGGQDYLVPVGAQVMLRRGRHEIDLNQITFHNFHRFRSTSKILNYPVSTEQ